MHNNNCLKVSFKVKDADLQEEERNINIGYKYYVCEMLFIWSYLFLCPS